MNNTYNGIMDDEFSICEPKKNIINFIESIDLKIAEENLNSLLARLIEKRYSIEDRYYLKISKILDKLRSSSYDILTKKEIYFFGYLLSSHFTDENCKHEEEKIISMIKVEF